MSLLTLMPSAGKAVGEFRFRYLAGLVLFSALILGACGLETIALLEPPREDTIRDAFPLANVEFRHNSAVNKDGPGMAFLGYEIYYRFYDANGTLFDTHRSQIEATPITLGPGRLTARNYRRLRGLSMPTGTDREAPLVAIRAAVQNTPVLVEIVFDGVATPDFPQEIVDTGDAALRVPITTGMDPDFAYLRLKRNISSAEVRSFFPLDTDNYLAGEDPDLSGIANLEVLLVEGNLAIGLFVIAYGIDPQSLRVVYSEPRKLLYQRLPDRAN